MINWKCPLCADIRETEDDVLITICQACQIAMEREEGDNGREKLG